MTLKVELLEVLCDIAFQACQLGMDVYPLLVEACEEMQREVASEGQEEDFRLAPYVLALVGPPRSWNGPQRGFPETIELLRANAMTWVSDGNTDDTNIIYVDFQARSAKLPSEYHGKC